MRNRHDGFTADKRRRFFETIEKTGCIADAAAAARVSKTTVGRWRDKEPGFEEELQRRLGLAAGALETLAWERAVKGAPETVIRNGEVVQVKVKPSDAMLRLLLQASNPKKFGRLGGSRASRKQIERELRARVTAEVKAKLRPPVATNQELTEALVKRLNVLAIRMREEQARRQREPGEGEEERP